MADTNTALTAAARTTLRYWTDNGFSASFGDDGADHETPAYDGLVECLDAGLLRHVCAGEHMDCYVATKAGRAVV